MVCVIKSFSIYEKGKKMLGNRSSIVKTIEDRLPRFDTFLYL